MAKEKEIDIIDEGSEYPPEEQIQRIDTIREVLDERDFITPLNKFENEIMDPAEPNDSGGSESSAELEIELTLDGDNFPMDNDQTNTEKKSVFDDDRAGAEEPNDPADDMPDANENPVEDDMEFDGADPDEEKFSAKDSEILTAGDQADADEEDQKLEALPDPEADLPDKNSKSKIEKVQSGKSGKNVENNFLTLDENDADINPTEVKKLKPKESLTSKPDKNKSEKSAAKNSKIEIPPAKRRQKESPKKPAVESAVPNTVKRPSMINKMIGFTLAAVVVAGFIFYNNPALIGFKKVSESTPAPVGEAVQSAQPVAAPIVKAPPPLGPHDKLTAKLEEAADLRNQLLGKKEEIDRLDLYYRNGIAELEQAINHEVQKNGVSSFEQAMKNKRIELNLRTIQRRRAYIQGLEKPSMWVDRGSEELLYLMRKARLDLELIDVAGGIDINKHNRHLSAAINQYRPSTDKLAINLQDEKLAPLETIWQQANNKRNITKSTNEQISLNTKNEQIAAEICSGNFERISELTSISAETAKCLSRMRGSELFLNAVTQVPPEAAKELFQWQGNWICLNGVKALTPAVAKYLFKWGGNWISLNGLTEFQPELAVYLLKWEGQQLELMGL